MGLAASEADCRIQLLSIQWPVTLSRVSALSHAPSRPINHTADEVKRLQQLHQFHAQYTADLLLAFLKTGKDC